MEISQPSTAEVEKYKGEHQHFGRETIAVGMGQVTYDYHYFGGINIHRSRLRKWVPFGCQGFHDSQPWPTKDQVANWLDHRIVKIGTPSRAPPWFLRKSTVKFMMRGAESLSGWWFGTWLWCFHILGIISPTDFHIFQRGWNHQSVVKWWRQNGKVKKVIGYLLGGSLPPHVISAMPRWALRALDVH